MFVFPLVAVALAEEPAPNAPAAASAEAAAPAAPASPKELAVGSSGLFKPGLLLQGWWVGNRADDALANTFRVRRAEVSLKGEVLPGKLGYGVMIDPAKVLESETVEVPVYDADGTQVGVAEVEQPGDKLSVFQDFYIAYQSPWGDVSLGQFKVPVSWEGFNSSSKLLLPERSLAAKAFGDKRDIGVKVAKTFDRFGYVAGVFNGASLNHLDVDNDKDLALRLEAYPVKGVTVGVVGYGTVGTRANATDRAEADLRVEVGPALLQGELIRGWSTEDGATTAGQGWYGAAGWTFGPLQPVVRVGQLDEDLSATGDETLALEGGANWYFSKHEAKAQLAVSRFLDAEGGAEDTLILATQIAF